LQAIISFYKNQGARIIAMAFPEGHKKDPMGQANLIAGQTGTP